MIKISTENTLKFKMDKVTFRISFYSKEDEAKLCFSNVVQAIDKFKDGLHAEGFEFVKTKPSAWQQVVKPVFISPYIKTVEKTVDNGVNKRTVKEQVQDGFCSFADMYIDLPISDEIKYSQIYALSHQIPEVESVVYNFGVTDKLLELQKARLRKTLIQKSKEEAIDIVGDRELGDPKNIYYHCDKTNSDPYILNDMKRAGSARRECDDDQDFAEEIIDSLINPSNAPEHTLTDSITVEYEY